MGTIYKITNTVNGLIYIGQTTQTIEERWINHISGVNEKPHIKLRKAILEFGPENFIIEALEENISDIDLDVREIYWIKQLDSIKNGYNMTMGGKGGNTYIAKTEEQMKEIRKKISESKKGDLNPMRIYGGLKGERNGQFGKPTHNSVKVYFIHLKTKQVKEFRSIAMAIPFFKEIRQGRDSLRTLLIKNNNSFKYKDYFITTHFEGVETIESID